MPTNLSSPLTPEQIAAMAGKLTKAQRKAVLGRIRYLTFAQDLRERNEALALQADEWAGKYAIVSEMNARLEALGDGLAEALAGFTREKGRATDRFAIAGAALAAWETK